MKKMSSICWIIQNRIFGTQKDSQNTAFSTINSIILISEGTDTFFRLINNIQTVFFLILISDIIKFSFVGYYIQKLNFLQYSPTSNHSFITYLQDLLIFNHLQQFLTTQLVKQRERKSLQEGLVSDLFNEQMYINIQAPTEKIRIILNILRFLFAITLLQAIFLVLSQKLELKTLTFFASAATYFITWRQLSYFGCVINQIFNLAVIWVLLLQMANKLQNGLYEIYLSSEGIYKMSSLIVCIISIYFNFSAYQALKQISLEIYEFENKEGENISSI